MSTLNSEVDLHVCPFCGKSQLESDSHDKDCYLVLRDELRIAPQADVNLVLRVAEAWKRRAVPEGFKLIQKELSKEICREWKKTDFDSRAEKLETAVLSYEQFFELQKSSW